MTSRSGWKQRFHRFTRHDFSPEFSAKVRAAIASPLGVLLLTAALAVLVGLVVHPRAFVLAGGVFAVIVVGVGWPSVTMCATTAVTRFDQPRTTEGDEVGASATVANSLPWPAWGLAATDEATGFAVKLPPASGRAASECRWVFVPPVRGEYPLSPPVLSTGFPFGLWTARRAAVVEAPLLVWPRTFPVGPVPATAAEMADGHAARNKVGSVGDVLGVRPYRRGDSPRRIHWAQSARHDRLIVCELQSHSRPVVRVVVDVDPMVHSLGTDGSREWVIRVAASLANGWLAAGAQVGVSVNATHLPGRSGPDHATVILDALARVRGGGLPLAEVLGAPAIRAASELTVVVTTDAANRTGIGLRDVHWVILKRGGFGGEPAPSADPTAWLVIESAATLPERLRTGTAEARHGS